MLKPVLYQRSRPSKIDDYVFVDKTMERQVRGWITEQQLPCLIMTGTSGTGKCLDGSELVDVEIDTSTLSDTQISMIETHQITNTATYRLPIGTLFSVLGIEDSPYEEVVTTTTTVKILSPTGYVPVNGFVRKNHQTAEYTLDNGSTIKCSTKHLIFQNGTPIQISKASHVDTVDGQRRIVGVRERTVCDVFDVALNAPHQYVTPNGVIHHNTTLAYLLCYELGIEDSDIMYIKGSIDNGIDVVRERVMPFVQTMSLSQGGRVVIIDEFDRTSPQFQDSLRNIIEDCMGNARFIFTANYGHKITDAMYSRCTHFHIEALDKQQYILRVATVLSDEGIDVDYDTLTYYADNFYPDMRGIYNAIESNVVDGKLIIADSKASMKQPEWMLQSINLIMEQKHREARTLICSNIQYDEYGDFYRLMYENIDWWAKENNDKRDKAILIIKDHLVADHTVGDREIVLSACLTKLSLI